MIACLLYFESMYKLLISLEICHNNVDEIRIRRIYWGKFESMSTYQAITHLSNLLCYLVAKHKM